MAKPSMESELSKISPMCWLCGNLVIPTEIKYGPLIGDCCRDAYNEKRANAIPCGTNATRHLKEYLQELGF